MVWEESQNFGNFFLQWMQVSGIRGFDGGGVVRAPFTSWAFLKILLTNKIYERVSKVDGMRNSKGAIGKGFTLVELLVVIAVIALLMAILMPVLGQAKKQAGGVIDQSNQRQWGLMFMMFTEDHEGYLPASVGSWDAYYLIALLPYMGSRMGESSKTRDIFLCPLAKTSKNPDNCNRCEGTTFSAWGPFDAYSGEWWDTGAKGSYGLNDWCANPPGDSYWGFPSDNAFRTPNVKDAGNIPLLLDALYTDGFPGHTDEPPPYPDIFTSWNSNAMQLFCIDRHNGGINGVFLDFSVRKIGLKELWKLKWHRRFNTNWPTADWASEAPWMTKFKDY
jgi:prepilin-type N-terminal cleavage/methylation domain-containing protein/prepilin-type processing-associated H-X9-DG protein